MKKSGKFSLLALTMLFIAGCSVVMATQQPGRKDFSVLSKGVDRSRVVAELGTPLTTGVKDGKRTDVFAVRQGYSTGAKVGRALFHGVADFFTLGLWEVVGTPVEAIASGTDVKLRVRYDASDKVEDIITYSGKENVDEAIVPVPENVDRAIVPVPENVDRAKVNEYLVKAADRGDLPEVKRLLANGADVNAKMSNGATALLAASLKGHREILQALLAKGVDVNAKTSIGGNTALMAASLMGHREIVQALLAKGADVNAKTSIGGTALMAASFKGHREIVQALLAKGADVNAKTNDGSTALIRASLMGHREIVQALLAKGADVNARTSDAVTALLIASIKGHREVMELLVKAGGKI